MAFFIGSSPSVKSMPVRLWTMKNKKNSYVSVTKAKNEQNYYKILKEWEKKKSQRKWCERAKQREKSKVPQRHTERERESNSNNNNNNKKKTLRITDSLNDAERQPMKTQSMAECETCVRTSKKKIKYYVPEVEK